MIKNRSFLRKLAAIVAVFGVLFGAIAPAVVSVAAQHKAKASARKLTEEQRIVHVLNRLGFGARQGDLERVKAIGVDAYINQQLNPNTIADTVANDKVK